MKRITLTISILLIFGACKHQRLQEVGQKEDKRTEAQLRSDRALLKAQNLFDAGDLKGAQKEFLNTLEEDPLAYRAHLGLADIYGLQPDPLAVLVECVAHTESAPSSRVYLEGMMPYILAKFSRNPAGRKEAKNERRGRAMLALSKAVVLFQNGEFEPALKKVQEVPYGLRGSGIEDYFAGHIYLKMGDAQKAQEAFARSVEENAYFGRLVLNEHADKSISGMLPKLQQTLEQELQAHPSDNESSVVLASIFLRLQNPAAAVKVVRNALAWTNPIVDLLLLKAIAHDRLGEKLQAQQALLDLKTISPDLSIMFSCKNPSMFHGMLDGSASDFVQNALLPSLDEPGRSYFLWRFLQELGDGGAAQAKAAFEKSMETAFPAEEFQEQSKSTVTAIKKPSGLSEFMGMVQERVNESMNAFLHCDQTRRNQRAVSSGRVVLLVELARDGTVAQAGVDENTTQDLFLAYCVSRKLLSIHFPETLRANETFKVPVLFGPEVDKLDEPKDQPVPKAQTRSDP